LDVRKRPRNRGHSSRNIRFHGTLIFCVKNLQAALIFGRLQSTRSIPNVTT
jgi:hypothetical protein